MPHLPDYFAFMQRITTLVALCFALLALCSPSLAVGVKAATMHDVVVVAAAGEIAPVTVQSPCQAQGGKRVLPCQSDLGVLPGVIAKATPAAVALHLPRNDLMPASIVPDADLPPPRA